MYITKRPILFTGHGLVEFINHTFDDIKNSQFHSKDVENFKLEDKLINFLKERKFSVVSKELFNLFTIHPVGDVIALGIAKL